MSQTVSYNFGINFEKWFKKTAASISGKKDETMWSHSMDISELERSSVPSSVWCKNLNMICFLEMWYKTWTNAFANNEFKLIWWCTYKKI